MGQSDAKIVSWEAIGNIAQKTSYTIIVQNRENEVIILCNMTNNIVSAISKQFAKLSDN